MIIKCFINEIGWEGMFLINMVQDSTIGGLLTQ